MAFELPPLPYDYSALEPHIDTQTMQLHHDKHHAAYVTNLNNALQGLAEFEGKSAEEVIKNLNSVPEGVRMAVRNNGGGHVNHTMFWELMTPGGAKEPAGDLASALTASFGSLDAFKAAFVDAGVKRFGSGWAWLVLGSDGKLAIKSTPNQDNPMMDGEYPVMGNDVWEHAYYLKYQNRRADYLNAWWNVLNWDIVAKRLAAGK
jgi:superoxide dismutase, Fe-Mn family